MIAAVFLWKEAHFIRLRNRSMLLRSGLTINNVALLLIYTKHYLHRHYCECHVSVVASRNECYATYPNREEAKS
jgi:hypothetical protein